MTRGITALIACCAPLFALACGESSEPPRHTTAAAETGTGGTSSGAYIPSPPTPQPLPAGGVAIAYRDIAIHPPSITVKAGTTIVWTNYDSIEHNVASTSGPSKFSSQNLVEGASFHVKLTHVGLYRYVCRIHPERMRGTIHVVH